eukprot:m.135761 g.135761  ORF g.135761 m.135761 type:complete len:56 (-) comp16568_c0_seq1:87-254(-)
MQTLVQMLMHLLMQPWLALVAGSLTRCASADVMTAAAASSNRNNALQVMVIFPLG